MSSWTARACLVVLCVASATTFAAEREAIEGTIHVVVVDRFDGSDERLYFIEEPSEGFWLELADPPAAIAAARTGEIWRVEAERRDGRLHDAEQLARIRELRPAAATRKGAAVAVRQGRGLAKASPTRGESVVAGSTVDERAAIVLVADFNDASVGCGNQQIADLMWTGTRSVDGLFRETSNGLLGFPDDVDNDGSSDLHRVSIPHSIAESCASSTWASAADSAATAAGVDLSLYRHRVYVLPADVNCDWAGLGTLGCGSSCRTWVNTCSLPDVYAHELGHNLGMHHSSTDDDNDGEVDCEYCDRSDIMGIGGVGWRQVNGPHKEQMGWLPSEAIEDVTGAPDATRVVAALESDPAFVNEPQLFKVAIPESSQSYYISYRTRTGYDDNLGTSYASRTNIHRFSGSGRSLFVAALEDGESFEDPMGTISVTQLSHDAQGATVLLGTSCTSAAPSLSWDDAPSIAPGGSLDLDVVVVNNDEGSCATLDLALTLDGPAGFDLSVAPPTISLAAGAQGVVTVTIEPDPMTPDGEYDIGIASSDGMSGMHDAGATTRVTVAGDRPAAVDSLGGSWSDRGGVRLHWEAPSAGSAPIVRYRVMLDDMPVGSTSRTSFTDRRGCAGGLCSYRIVAIDATGRESTPSEATTIVGAGRAGSSSGGGSAAPVEYCDDAADNDGDGQVDCADSDCATALACLR